MLAVMRPGGGMRNAVGVQYAWLRSAGCLLAAAWLLLSAAPVFATTYTINTESDLRNALTVAVSGDTISFNANITLTAGDLPAVQTNLTILGNNFTLSGNNLYRGLFVAAFQAGTATPANITVGISNLTITAALAVGGNGGAGGTGNPNAYGAGGGAGAGLGGALFVAAGATVTASNVSLTNSKATGGNGGLGNINEVGGGGSGAAGLPNGAAGGGMGGAGGNTDGSGGGGLGQSATGGDGATGGNGSAGIVPGAAPGGNAVAGGTGGAGGGGGGGGTGGAGGGIAGGNGSTVNIPGPAPVAGNGGFGGGGGSVVNSKSGAGGNGGFGGGGGGGAPGGGNGGYGGGGGGSNFYSSCVGFGGGGFGGGCGGGVIGTGGAGGGGGAGMGGALFVMQGGSLTLSGPLNVNGNSVTGGTGGLGATSGQAFGAGLFMQGSGTLTFTPGGAQAQTISDVIADEAGVVAGGYTPPGAFTPGSWGLALNGAGSLELDGANTYSGTTTVTAGTLIAGNNTAFGSGTVAMAAGTTLSFSNTGNFTIANPITIAGDPIFTPPGGTTQTLSGGISNGATPGTLEMDGAGTLVLTGTASTYTGATNVNDGTLQAGANNVFASTSPFTVAGGATLDLNGFNETIGSLAGSGPVTLGLGTLTTGGDNAGTTYSGDISGGGGLTKTGTGTFILSNTSSYLGNTSVNAGTLEVDGSIATSLLTTVNSGATLDGVGTVGSAQVNGNGTFAPGSGVPGTVMHVAGNLAFLSGAFYMVQLNPAATTQASVTGTAALNGTVQANFAAGAYAVGAYDILHSAGLGGSKFGGLTTTNLPPGFSASLAYTLTDVFLDLSAIVAITGPFNTNQQNVANALNNFYAATGGLPPNFLTVFSLTGSALTTALSQLDGEVSTDAERAAVQFMDEFLGLMLDPFVDGRDGFGSGGTATPFAPEQEASFPPDVALAYNSVLKAPPKLADPFAQRWTAWGAAYGGSSRASGDPVVGSTNVTANTYGFAAGMDHHVTPDTVLGFALAGGGTNWGLAQDLGNGRSDAFQAGVYGTRTFRSELCRRGARIRRSLDDHRSHRVRSATSSPRISTRRVSARDSKPVIAMRRRRRRALRPMRHCRNKSSTPRAIAKRSERRRLRADLQRDECDRHAQRVRCALRRSDYAQRDAVDAACAACLGARLGE